MPQAALKALDIVLCGEREIDELIAAFDTNNDEVIDYDEFQAMMTSNRVTVATQPWYWLIKAELLYVISTFNYSTLAGRI